MQSGQHWTEGILKYVPQLQHSEIRGSEIHLEQFSANCPH